MNLERLKQLQPKIFAEFQQILQSDRLGHAYLLTGNFGSLSMALMLAQSRFCEAPVSGLPCQTCRACRLIEAGEFSDVKRLAPTSNIIKTDLVRELLQEFSQSGFESDHQVFIIEGADKMHPNAANSLLKFIEEPQSKIHIYLLADQDTSVLPTIKSRCQVFHFPKNKVLMIDELEQAGLLKTQAKLVAELCPDLDQALLLGKSAAFKEVLMTSQQWVKQYLADDYTAYLTTAKLVALADDKVDQARILDLLTLLLAEELDSKKNQDALSCLLHVKQMWQANVNFQNALEYMVIK